MAENKINMPAGFGGLMRYGTEYKSKLILKPSHVIVFVIMIILFSIVLRIL